MNDPGLLIGKGFSSPLPPHTQADRDAGTVFHEHRAIDAVQGDDPRLLRWIYVLLALAAVLFLAYFVQGARR